MENQKYYKLKALRDKNLKDKDRRDEEKNMRISSRSQNKMGKKKKKERNLDRKAMKMRLIQ